ncbi:MAG TPA: hypothetical protein VF443_14285, partial [Nitrospira sp.]
ARAARAGSAGGRGIRPLVGFYRELGRDLRPVWIFRDSVAYRSQRNMCGNGGTPREIAFLASTAIPNN